MVADREMPAWQWTNTLPPAFLMESGKQRVAGYLRAQGNNPNPRQRVPKKRVSYPEIGAKKSKGFKPRPGISTKQNALGWVKSIQLSEPQFANLLNGTSNPYFAGILPEPD